MITITGILIRYMQLNDKGAPEFIDIGGQEIEELLEDGCWRGNFLESVVSYEEALAEYFNWYTDAVKSLVASKDALTASAQGQPHILRILEDIQNLLDFKAPIEGCETR